MNAKVILCLCLIGAVLLCSVEAQPQRFNNNNRNNNNINRNNPNYRHVEPIYSYGLDTSSGQYSKFNGPVKGLPTGHGGGKYGAADCLLC